MAVPNSALVNGKMVNGSCRELDCRCQMYRSCGEENNFFCAACHHDESFHEIIGVVEGEKVRNFGFAAAPVAPVPLPLPLVLKQTVEGQRRAIFQSGSSAPLGTSVRIKNLKHICLSQKSDSLVHRNMYCTHLTCDYEQTKGQNAVH